MPGFAFRSRTAYSGQPVADAGPQSAEWENAMEEKEKRSPAGASYCPLCHQRLPRGSTVRAEDAAIRRQLEAELEASRQAAEAASLAKSRFLANMSHEIRTPMNAIVALSHLMLEDETDPRRLHRLRRIAVSAQHLLALLNDILDLSKIEAGQLRIEQIDFTLAEVLDMVRDQTEERIAGKPVRFRLSVAPDVPAMLHGDPLRLGQILLNYASNAAKFTEQGSITLNVTRLDGPADKVRLRFELADTGIGFDDEVRQRLFRPFEQGDVSTTRRYGGTGLGLSICRQLAELLGAKVGAESTPGAGSTFWLEVEFAPAQMPAGGQVRAAPVLTDRRILLVGRRDAESLHIEKLANQFGMHSYRCAKGREAAVRVKTAAQGGSCYDFVLFYGAANEADQLCDAQTLEALQSIDPTPIRIFAARLHDSAHTSQPAVRQRFDAILPLPLMASQFYEILAEALEARTHANALAPAASLPESAPDGDAGMLPHGRVLLVEDNPINREVALDILTSGGIVPDLACDGAEAVERAQQSDYDLILMDIQMPVMDGLVATRAIRAMARHARTPIVAMTANAFEEDRRKCIAAGMDDYLAKPVTPTTLREKLRRWLPLAARGEAAAPEAPAALPADLPDFHGIPGLDVEAGLTAALGRPDRYARLLGMFARHHAEDAASLHNALSSGDFAAAHRIAHSLKGTSATLGAREVSEAACDLDDLIKSGAPTDALAAPLALLEARLTALLARLAPFERLETA